ncbi:hypothetical protein NSK_006601 [Nannochloropsis salina CCMP1776]|uniref:Phosphoglycerate mutase family protein n=1 Tax=Nannochloropsis salina CCMP1776 TaxID=1027361 RepID=A0A4D9CWM6_9STRA|nr:hypothetical protein NSK_006601 [Nannochloropsis salina CCMP1776]|eukprot:TFJ81933.1 hypothetical protein NSK_006601 [Nannochloropsis salina CCMP1776]
MSSDLTRAKNTAEIIVEELTGGKRQPSKDPSHHGSNDTSSNTCHNDDNANDTGLESLLTLDTNLREILGGAREGQPLGLSLQEAMRRTALEQGISLEQLQHMPSETLQSLHCRARSFVRRVLTAAAEMQATGEREDKCTADLAKVENRGREGAPEAERQRGPMRVLLVSHGGLLLQMFQKVFKFYTVQKVLNASISVVEAYPLAGSNNLANNEREEGKGEAKRGEDQDSQADTCQLASDALSSLGTEDGKKGQGNEGGKVEGLEEEFIFQARSLNDVAHLQASGLVTSRSTAL